MNKWQHMREYVGIPMIEHVERQVDDSVCGQISRQGRRQMSEQVHWHVARHLRGKAEEQVEWQDKLHVWDKRKQDKTTKEAEDRRT